jgi:GntR family transcriptional regulator / MocR family aminotransferase
MTKIMEPIFPLAIELPPRGSRKLLRTLHQQLRAAILDGRLKPELRLPATREFAAAMGVSRNIVIAAYEQLLSEGYVSARPGAGTYVANVLPQARRTIATDDAGAESRLGRLNPFWRSPPALPEPGEAMSFPFDFRIGLSDKTHFPYRVWRRLSARALRGISRTPVAYADPAGQADLREAIARHISLSRAVACQAADVVVTVGAQQGFDLLARILVAPGQTVVATEEPGYPPSRAAFAAAGARIVPVPVDGEGLAVERLPARAGVILTTPSHQFPLGVVMSTPRRQALLQFAAAHRAVVIEDDYDGDFRYGGRPLDALQALDRGRSVFYVGTFSKSLFPGLRLGFVVPPAWALPALLAAKQIADWHGPILAQDTLTAFIAEGHLARHIRRMRQVYGERRSILLEALGRHCRDRLVPIPGEVGLHLAARLVGPVEAGAVVAAAAARGIKLQALQGYAEKVKGAANGLAFGLGLIEADRIDAGIRELAKVMRSSS